MADTLDLLTLTEGYAAINDPASAAAGTGSYDTVLARRITAISRRVDELCGPVVQRTISNEEHEGGYPTLRLLYYPVASITTLTEYVGTTGQVLSAENFPNSTTANDYKLVDNGRRGVVHRRSFGYGYQFAVDRVIATYTAGRYASTDTVDTKFKEAAAAILLRLWKREAGSWAAGGDPFEDTSGIGFFRVVDPMVEEFLGDEMRAPVIA